MKSKDELKDCIAQYVFGIIQEILKCGNESLESLYQERENLYKSIQFKIDDTMRYEFFMAYIQAVNKRIETKTVFFFIEGIKGTESAFLLLNYENTMDTKIFDELEKACLSGTKISQLECSELERINRDYENKIAVSAYKNCDKIIKILSDLYK